MNEVQKARKILEDKWMAEGQCGSCGYHAMLGEHDVCDEDIEHALANGESFTSDASTEMTRTAGITEELESTSSHELQLHP